jgi:hypothetical protein
MSEPKQPRRYRRDSEGARHLVVVVGGVDGFIVQFTSNCSGCTDGEDGRVYGPFGCEECGYTGKRRERMWVPFDYGEWERAYNRAAGVPVEEAGEK